MSEQKKIITNIIKAVADLTHSVSNVIGDNNAQRIFDSLWKADKLLNNGIDEVTEND